MTDATISPETAPVATPGIREQIVEAADAHFRRYGYAKTTVADLAKAIGFSKAYIYKFFDSKQAIGEAICQRTLAEQMVAIRAAVDAAVGPHEKMRALFGTVVGRACEQFFAERQLYDIVSHSCEERWPSSEAYVESLDVMFRQIVRDGREALEFERKTPIDEVSSATWLALSPFVNPSFLQHNLDHVEQGLPAVTSLVLRSLAP